jgi:hypothetical protein
MRVFKQTVLRSYIKRISIMGFVLSLASCSTYYIPTTQNVPLFEEKNELQVYGGIAMGDASIGGDLQAAYSISNHIAVRAGGYYGSTSSGAFTIILDDVTFSNLELSTGYFTKLGQSNGIFEVYGGWAYASGLSSNFNQFFIQPNIGTKIGQGAEIAFSTRINYVNWEYQERVYIEPAFTLRAGGDRVKLQFQLLTSLSTGNITGNYDSEYNAVGDWEEIFHLSAGVFIPIDLNKKR